MMGLGLGLRGIGGAGSLLVGGWWEDCVGMVWCGIDTFASGFLVDEKQMDVLDDSSVERY